jgi:hypothetical protein
MPVHLSHIRYDGVQYERDKNCHNLINLSEQWLPSVAKHLSLSAIMSLHESCWDYRRTEWLQYLWIVAITAYQQGRHWRNNMAVRLKMSLYLVTLSTEFLTIQIPLVYDEITCESRITRSCGKKHWNLHSHIWKSYRYIYYYFTITIITVNRNLPGG